MISKITPENYTRFLTGLYNDNSTTARLIDDCGESGRLASCGDCGEMAFVPYGCRQRQICPQCGTGYVLKKSSEQYAIWEGLALLAGKSNHMKKFVFTLPEHLSATALSYHHGEWYLNKDVIDSYRKKVRDTLKKWMGVEIGGYMYTQPWGSEDPIQLDGPRKTLPFLHFHVVVSDLVRQVEEVNILKDLSGDKISSEKRYRHWSFWIEPEDLDALRTLWAQEIGHNGPVNVKYRYVKNRGSWKVWEREAKHTLRYNCRFPVGDILKRGVGYLKRIHKSDPQRRAWCRFLLNGFGGWKRITSFGWMGDGVLRKRMEEIGIARETIDSLKKTAKKAGSVCTCKACGGDMEIGDIITQEEFKTLKTIQSPAPGPPDPSLLSDYWASAG